MEFEQFEKRVEKARAEQPLLFGLERDAIPDREEISRFQQEYGVRLPEQYIQFVLRYGGGYFGYTVLYSLDRGSPFYLGAHNTKEPGELLFIGENGCGDSYAFCVREGRCSEAVVLWEHEEGRVLPAAFSDLFDYLIKTGLKG